MTKMLARKWAVVLVAATAPCSIMAGSAGASVVDQGRYVEEYAFGYSDCGFPISVSGRVSGKYRIREGTGAEASAFFLRETFSYSETQTNADTGDWFRLYGHGVFNEVGATAVEGSLFEFAAIDAGQPFVVESSSGEIVLRDRGVLRTRILFDTGGDDVPGGTEIAFLGFDVGGPHPGLAVDFCELAGDLIG